MTLTIAQTLATAQLDPIDARALLRHALVVDDAYLIAHSGTALADVQSRLFAALAERRRAGEPVAYITGRREFFSLEFDVTPAVLIPRHETELLVEVALELLPADQPRTVLDLGTGSGCVAISIARHRPRARVTAVDRSETALAVARGNASRLLGCTEAPSPSTGECRDGGGSGDAGATDNVPARAFTLTLTLPRRGGGDGSFRLMRSDWFSALARCRFDLIVSNPPYVAAGDSHLNEGDLRFEPAEALVAGSDGLDCIRLIIASSPQYLMKGGWLAFEHGYDQGPRCRELLVKAGYTQVWTRTDLSGCPRLSGGRLDASA